MQTDTGKAKKIRISWNDTEREAFFKAARQLGPPEKGDSEEIWKLAQERAGIPPNRRRPFEPATAAVMNKERRKGKNDAGLVSYGGMMSANDQPILPASQPAHPEAEEPTAKVEEVPSARPPWLDALVAQASDALADVVLNVIHDARVRLALREIVHDMITPENELQQTNSIVWREQKTVKERIPRVVIAGGVKSIKTVFENFRGADIRFWGTERHEHIARLKALLPNADIVVIVTNMLNHSAANAIRDYVRMHPEVQLINWMHSYSDLRVEIERILPETLAKLRNVTH